jgi:hypothetical protein
MSVGDEDANIHDVDLKANPAVGAMSTTSALTC